MTATQELEQALQNELPAILHDQLPRLAQLLTAVLDGTLTPTTAQQPLKNAALQTLLCALTKRGVYCGRPIVAKP